VLFDSGAWHFFDFATGAYVPAQSVYTGIPAHKYGGTSLPAPLDYDGDGEMDYTMYAGGPWHFFDDTGAFVKNIPTGGVVGDQDVSARPPQP
jgi:hypothetical protein